MTKIQKKLIIWDFDGVIADTETAWQEIRLKKLKEKFDINWNLQEANHLIGGMSDKTKVLILKNLGYQTSEEFWNEIHLMDEERLNQGFERIPYIDDIFNLTEIKQCIATGGDMNHTLHKSEVTGVNKWFSQKNIFTSEMVEHGKPEPDLFLLAAEKMGEKPEDCVVIEDSIAGLTAAQKAGMEVIAFIGSKMNNNPEYIAKVKTLGIKYIFDDMRKVKAVLEEWL